MVVGRRRQDVGRTSVVAIPQRLSRVVQPVQLTVKVRLAVIAPFNRVLLKEAKTVTVGRLLSRINQRHVEQGGRQHRHGVSRLSVALLHGAVPTVFVVVGDEPQSVRIARKALRLLLEVVPKHLDGLLALRDLVGQVVEMPAVTHVEGAVVVVGFLCFGEHEDLGVHRLQLTACHLPERSGHFHRHVAAVTIDAALGHPKGHGVRHRRVQTVVHAALPIQLGHVPPVRAKRRLKVVEAVQQVVLTVILGPNAIKSTVVGHPVQNHPHAQFVGSRGQCPHVVVVPVIWIHCVIILNTVGASEGSAARLHDVIVGVLTAFSVDLSNGMNGHQPKNVHPQLLQTGQIWDEGLDGAFGRVLPEVDLVDRRVLGPIGMPQHVFLLGRSLHIRCACRRRSSTRNQGKHQGQDQPSGG